ncbi:hypothetical protein [Pseudomonas fluorescens]|uniref:Uncharacterized protein n=1 Tax=Pseudomonas fluorescens TaxID=294 RepID=A0A5E7FED1_PSEFL|nr:hypothetical protein [Pseudomonas fluorescens]VVO36397.1 hypothetical protein PS691_05355 [Pseudomonas fluorescens]
MIRHSSVCKVWPATGDIIFATSIELDGRTDLGVMVFDSKTNTIVGVSREIDALKGDAIHNTGIEIDTASYRLNRDTLAFGIRTSWRGSSQPNPYSSESLRLYIAHDKSLVSVLSGLNVHEYSGEWDTRCAGEFTTRDMIMIMMQSGRPYADLLIKEKTTKVLSREAAEGCKDVLQKTEEKKYVLKYERGRYLVPENLRSFVR